MTEGCVSSIHSDDSIDFSHASDTCTHTLPGCLLNIFHSCARASVSLSVPSFMALSKLTVNHKWSHPYRCSERGFHRGLLLCEMSLFRLISNQLFELCVCVCASHSQLCTIYQTQNDTCVFLSARLADWQVSSSLFSKS